MRSAPSSAPVSAVAHAHAQVDVMRLVPVAHHPAHTLCLVKHRRGIVRQVDARLPAASAVNVPMASRRCVSEYCAGIKARYAKSLLVQCFSRSVSSSRSVLDCVACDERQRQCRSPSQSSSGLIRRAATSFTDRILDIACSRVLRINSDRRNQRRRMPALQQRLGHHPVRQRIGMHAVRHQQLRNPSGPSRAPSRARHDRRIEIHKRRTVLLRELPVDPAKCCMTAL